MPAALLGLMFVAAQASCSFDTSTRAGIPDTLIIALAAGPRIGFKRELLADYLGAADVIRQHYRTPERVSVPLWGRLVGDSVQKEFEASDDAPRGFDGDVRFRLDALGHLASDSIAVETLNDDLATSVAAAIRRADSAAAFAPPSKKLLKDHGIIRLHFIRPRAGSALNAPLLRVIVPTVRADLHPEMKSHPRITYPAELRRSGVTGRVVVQFVVGEDGRAIQPTISVVQGEYREFVIEVLRIVPEAQFRPARVGHCDVPILVRVPVDFNIKR